MTPIELMVEEQPGTECYRVRWRDDEIFIANIPDAWLDLVPDHPRDIVRGGG